MRTEFTTYKAVIVVGCLRYQLPEEAKQLVSNFDLEIFTADYQPHLDDVVGLLYAETGGYSSVEFEWDEAELLQLRNQFLMMTGLEAKTYLCTKGY
jgi:hypothetical protein